FFHSISIVGFFSNSMYIFFTLVSKLLISFLLYNFNSCHLIYQNIGSSFLFFTYHKIVFQKKLYQ
ncbi:MAG: hypothetical protein Q8M44_01865, partial [bacterium]|nr:hypothetical protein [bacterium]